MTCRGLSPPRQIRISSMVNGGCRQRPHPSAACSSWISFLTGSRHGLVTPGQLSSPYLEGRQELGGQHVLGADAVQRRRKRVSRHPLRWRRRRQRPRFPPLACRRGVRACVDKAMHSTL